MLRPRLSRERVVDAYLHACRVAATAPAKIKEGYRVFWTFPPKISWIDLAPGEHGILGTHERCDLRIPAEQDMRTRHALAACSRLDDGSVALRLLDLHTDLPLFLQDDEPHVSLVVVGDFAVRLGRGVVGALTLDPSSARKSGGTSAAPELDVSRSDRVPTARSGDMRKSHVTSLPPVSPIGTLKTGPRNFRDALASGAAPPAGDLRDVRASNALAPQEDTTYRLTLTRAQKAASIEIPGHVLQLGLMIGRADNCEDGGLRAVLDGTISRAHLLLLREGRDVVAFDLCSLNGVTMNGKKDRRFVLHDDSVLGMGPQFQLRWQPLHVRH